MGFRCDLLDRTGRFFCFTCYVAACGDGDERVSFPIRVVEVELAEEDIWAWDDPCNDTVSHNQQQQLAPPKVKASTGRPERPLHLDRHRSSPSWLSRKAARTVGTLRHDDTLGAPPPSCSAGRDGCKCIGSVTAAEFSRTQQMREKSGPNGGIATLNRRTNVAQHDVVDIIRRLTQLICFGCDRRSLVRVKA